MSRINNLGFFTFCVFSSVLALAPSAEGHTVFKKALQKKYPNVRISCEACHIKGKPKTERNEFGGLFFEKFKGQDFSKTWEAFGEDTAGKSKYEKESMVPAFEKALPELKEMKNKDNVSYDSLITDAKLPGVKAKKPGSDKADDDDDDEDEEKGKKGDAKKGDDDNDR